MLGTSSAAGSPGPVPPPLAESGPYVAEVSATMLEQAAAIRRGGLSSLELTRTNLHECSFGITGNNPHYGAVHNPYDPLRIPGGSSGGSRAFESMMQT